MFHRILVPVDGSDAGWQGLTEALRLALAWGATLRLLHVTCASPFAVEMADPQDYEGYRHSLRTRADHLLGDARERARKAGVAVETSVRELRRVSPASAIVDEAADGRCDLVVMGTHGRDGLARAFADSNAEEVVRRSSVPVLVVRRPKPQRRRGATPTLTAVKASGGALSRVA